MMAHTFTSIYARCFAIIACSWSFLVYLMGAVQNSPAISTPVPCLMTKYKLTFGWKEQIT